MQCIAEDRTWDIQAGAGPHRLHRRTILMRRDEGGLRIAVEVALLRPDGIELERRMFDQPSGEADDYMKAIRERLAAPKL